MRDFAAMLHFRTLPNSEDRENGYAGGYGWFLGRFANLETFLREVDAHLAATGLALLEVEQSFELSGPDDLNPGEQQALFERLDEFPIQYHTVDMYKRDDA